jgi:lysophospholipid acyltransferase (LPLAT)-like uncharacterized protein
MSSFSDRLVLSSAPWLAAKLVKLIYLLLKPESIGEDKPKEIWAEGRHIIFATWHDQLLLIAPGYTGGPAKALISKSKDGELIARVVSYFGLGTVRGSSNRGGRAAFRELVQLSKEPCTLGITPDGPTGPRHQLKEGVVQLARLSGRPIVPLAFACSSGHRFQSWDRFILPYPWGKAVYSYGEPLYYDENETIEQFQSRVQEAMDSNTRRAGEHLSQYGLSAV